ncbi:MAG TPA: hypothetical protein VFT74_00525 [Isosphaeraceae bacterium]|nr:hypothetical protein [Isosphaeraceae bacterium]
MNYLASTLGFLFVMMNVYGFYIFIATVFRSSSRILVARRALINFFIVGLMASLGMFLSGIYISWVGVNEEVTMLVLFIFWWGICQMGYSICVAKVINWKLLLSGFMILGYLDGVNKVKIK